MLTPRAFYVCTVCNCSHVVFRSISFVGGESRRLDRLCRGTFRFFVNYDLSLVLFRLYWPVLHDVCSTLWKIGSIF